MNDSQTISTGDGTIFGGLNVWKRGAERAPHKPLLILLSLGRLAHGEGRLISFEEIEPQLRELLQEFGPTRKSYHPEFPFWYLQSDGVWEVSNPENLSMRKGSSNPTAAELRRKRARAGFPEKLYDWHDVGFVSCEIDHVLSCTWGRCVNCR
jgi:putative restriction endonuclease